MVSWVAPPLPPAPSHKGRGSRRGPVRESVLRRFLAPRPGRANRGAGSVGRGKAGPPTPTEKFASFFRGLALAMGARSMWGPLSAALNILIQGRCIGIGDQRYRLIAKIQAGAFVPRRSWTGRAPPHGGEGADNGGPGTLYPGHLHPLSR